MLKIGDKVKINYNNLDKEMLQAESNTEEKDYLNCICSNEEKEYKIDEIAKCGYPYVLDDEFLNTTSFSEFELTLIK